MLIYACWALWYVIMNCLVIWIIIWLWYCQGGVASTVDIVCTADLLCYCCIVIGYDCLLGTVPSTLCHLCIWLRESFHMHGRRNCSVRLCVAVAFWDALWFLLLGVSSLCYVWMQIRARDWWNDRASMEGEDVYMWARCSRMFEDSICCILFGILLCVDVWYNLYDFYFCFELGVPHLYSFSNSWMFGWV